MDFREELYGSYDAHPSHEVVAAHRDMARIYGHYLGGWLPADRGVPVLDLGCGEGRFLSFLQAMGFEKITGVDRSPLQVDRSRRRCPGAELLLGDASNVLRERPSTFGVILAIDVFEHLNRNELMELLELSLASLKPGGILISQVPNGASPFCSQIRYGDLTHELAFTPESLGHVLRVAGFEAIEFRECGPVAKDARGALRVFAWRLIRQLIKVWNLVETGSAGARVYTRVLLAKGMKPG